SRYNHNGIVIGGNQGFIQCGDTWGLLTIVVSQQDRLSKGAKRY
ncbi:MAG: hypothetical protein ACJAX5_001655, partial [Patiriisocius sp.]